MPDVRVPCFERINGVLVPLGTRSIVDLEGKLFIRGSEYRRNENYASKDWIQLEPVNLSSLPTLYVDKSRMRLLEARTLGIAQ